jgi:serine/threonine-protein kinase PRP4
MHASRRDRSRSRDRNRDRYRARDSPPPRREERSRSRDRDRHHHRDTGRDWDRSRGHQREAGKVDAGRDRGKGDVGEGKDNVGVRPRDDGAGRGEREERNPHRIEARTDNRRDEYKRSIDANDMNKDSDAKSVHFGVETYAIEDERESRELEAAAALLGEEEDFLVVDEEREAARLTEERRLRRLQILQKHAKGTSPHIKPVVSEGEVGEGGEGAGPDINPSLKMDTLVQLDESAMFDMFSASPVRQSSATRPVDRSSIPEDRFLEDNWDDGEGYYRARVGELVADRYRTLGVVGKGVFSTVLKCVDAASPLQESPVVAVKLIRSNDLMRKAAEKELSILLQICAGDPDNRRFCVRILDHSEFRGHVALVFEYHHMNLREAIRKFGKDVGVNVGAVKLYARQLLVALRHLSELGVVHADIKPDNILVTEDLKQVKLCDFGSAFRESDPDNVPTPYLVSRFYRAPEVILGLACS